MWRKGWFLSATFLLMVSLTVSCKKKINKLGNDVDPTEDLITSGGIDTF